MIYKYAPGCSTCITILASRGMEEMAKNVHRMLTDPNGKYKDDRFDYAPVELVVFENKELYPNLGKVSIKNKDIFLFHPMWRNGDPNESLVELQVILDVLARATVGKVTLCLPYHSYLRQDRKDKPRVAITAKAVANLLTIYKVLVRRGIIFDMHSDQSQGFYDIPIDNLQGSRVLAEYLLKLLGDELDNSISVSPDHGGSKRNKRFAKYLDIPYTSLEKWRNPDGIEIPKITCAKELRGKTVFLFDDELATGGTALTAAEMILDCGAKAVYILVSHLVACKKKTDTMTVEEKFRDAYLRRGIRVIATNTIPRPKEYLEANADWLTIVPIEEILTHVIYQGTLYGGSISKIFEAPIRKSKKKVNKRKRNK